MLVKGVEGDKYSLGYFGFSYYARNSRSIKAVGVIPAGKSVKADAEVKVESEQKADPEKKVDSENKSQ